MSDTALDTENAESVEGQKLDVATVIDEIVADEQAEATSEPADTEPTGEDFTPTDTQIALAKQLGFSDDYASGMNEAEAKAADQWGRKQSAYHQRTGKTKDDPPDPASADSSADEGDFTEDDWYTVEGAKKINQILQDQKAQKTHNQKQETSENDRQQADIDKVFDNLDPKFFPDFSPGETADIDPTSPAQEKRDEVVSMAKAIQGASSQDISMEEAIGQALSVVAPTETQNAADDEADADRKKRKGQRISAPADSTTNRNKVYDTPEEKAVDIIYDYVNG